MSKRKYEGKLLEPQAKRQLGNQQEVAKHTLDSDEEDFVDEDNVLDENDIEGEEDGIARQEGEQRMTAFNMTEEMEEGHFDREGHFIWNNEKEIRDNWLDNIDWQKIKHNADFSNKYDVEEKGLGASDSESEGEDSDFDEIGTYKQMLTYMKPKESVSKAIKRLGGAEMKLSSVERLKRKKAGTLKDNEDVTKLTELANMILTKLGNMDVYQETYEQIQEKIAKKESKGKTVVIKEVVEMDIFADDFDAKQKEKLGETSGTSSSVGFVDDKGSDKKPVKLMWEFKWKADDEKIEGPHSTSQMIKWTNENYFKTGVMVRKCGETSNFYSLSRIDFELYE